MPIFDLHFLEPGATVCSSDKTDIDSKVLVSSLTNTTNTKTNKTQIDEKDKNSALKRQRRQRPTPQEIKEEEKKVSPYIRYNRYILILFIIFPVMLRLTIIVMCGIMYVESNIGYAMCTRSIS